MFFSSRLKYLKKFSRNVKIKYRLRKMVINLPDEIQWIGFWIGIASAIIGLLGFVITLWTLRTAYSVKKHLIHSSEISDFSKNIQDNIAKIMGDIASITENRLSDKSFRLRMHVFLIDLRTNYSFLSKTTKKSLCELEEILSRNDLSAEDWENVATLLTNLKNLLKKECAVYGGS